MFDPLRSPLRILLLAGPLLFGSSGCDMVKEKLGLEEPVAKAARLAAEGQAVGGGCRQSGRAIEDCYSIYSWLPKAAIYQGWRDMDSYMRENKLDTVEPQLPPPQPPGTRKKRRPPATDAGDEAKAAANDKSDADPGSERQSGSPR
ncbi:hypothetical protein [Accumulibacter sp.]|uniref:hypothetical protein n=1 Tax=Accumulibacter sp. TaxID=2053492 RepID=UPI0035AF51C3